MVFAIWCTQEVCIKNYFFTSLLETWLNRSTIGNVAIIIQFILWISDRWHWSMSLIYVPSRSLCWNVNMPHGGTIAEQLANSTMPSPWRYFTPETKSKTAICWPVSRDQSNVLLYNTTSLIKQLEEFHMKNHQELMTANSQKDTKLQTLAEAWWYYCLFSVVAAAPPDRHTWFWWCIYFYGSCTLIPSIWVKTLQMLPATCCYGKPTQSSNPCLWDAFNFNAFF